MKRLATIAGLLLLGLWPLVWPAKAPPIIFPASASAELPAQIFIGYSVRLLTTNYTGNCMRVVEDWDPSYAFEVGFANGWLDTNAVLAFAATNGTGNALLSVWYDQGGNTNDAVRYQSAGIGEAFPYIVTNNVLVTQNGKPALWCPLDDTGTVGHTIFFAGEAEGMADQLTNTTFTAYAVASGGDAGYETIMLGGHVQHYAHLDTAGEWGLYFSAEVASGVSGLNRHLQLWRARNYDDVDLYTDNAALVNVTTGSAYVNIGVANMFGYQVGNPQLFNGMLQEFVLWRTNHTDAAVAEIKASVNGAFNLW